MELEGAFRTGLFSVTGSATYTDAKITAASLSPANVGNRPRRQAKFVYQISPQVSNDRFAVGANVVGTSSSFTQDSNQLKLPGFTEAEEGSIPANGYVRARSINGRSISGSVRFSF